MIIFSSCFEGGSKVNLSGNQTNRNNNGGVDQQLPSPSDPRGGAGDSTSPSPLPTPGNEEEQPPSDNCGEPQWDIDELLERIELLENKKEDWDEIIAEGLKTYRIIEPIIDKKCSACHDSDRGLPWYGKPFKERNSVYKHYVDGIAALDISTKFPLSSKGSNNQVALLNAIKNSVLDETMPLRVYTKFYPRRKITPQDKMAIKYWVEPLVEKITEWEQKYIYDLEDEPIPYIKTCDDDNDESDQPPVPSPIENLEAERKKVTRVFAAKCFRCHANGVSKGGFGGMHDLETLAKSKYVDLDTPDFSEIFMISESGEMPPSKRDRLNTEELQTILNWITAESEAAKIE